jgi:hypothetical protein
MKPRAETVGLAEEGGVPGLGPDGQLGVGKSLGEELGGGERADAVAAAVKEPDRAGDLGSALEHGVASEKG